MNRKLRLNVFWSRIDSQGQLELFSVSTPGDSLKQFSLDSLKIGDQHKSDNSA